MKTFKKWELIMEETVRRGGAEIASVIILDVIAMIFAVGVCTVLGSVVEFLIGTPNWPEMVLAWLVIYIASFHVVMEATAMSYARDDLDSATLEELEEYTRKRFEEEI